jgi:hypothetical protein
MLTRGENGVKRYSGGIFSIGKLGLLGEKFEQFGFRVEELLSDLGASEEPMFTIVAEGKLWILYPRRIDTQEFDSFFLRHNLRERVSVREVDGAHVNGLLVSINHYFITLGR